jgi:hypothetical protein
MRRRNSNDLTSIVAYSLALSAGLFLSANAYGTTRYVNAARPDDSGDGLSWATAEKTLQAALLSAGSGDEIWVAAGTYCAASVGNGVFRRVG